MKGQVEVEASGIWAMWSWPFDVQNAGAVAGWGFWLAIFGMFLTLLGFGVTLKQLAKTKSATDAATAEVARIRSSLDAYDAAQEASRAQYALKTTRRYISNDLWNDVLSSYDDVRKSIITIRSSSNESLILYDQKFDDAVRYIEKLCHRIEAGAGPRMTEAGKAKTLTVLRQHEQLLHEVNIVLQRSVI
ncbi:MAG: hypothetical protein K0R64_1109 [Novosphingobium lindaniclasticum]|jgi:hypothetical protein|uniref:hypothetical protein n=1 Tax=Novosphingobium lindaniclasticum TaxID=1329895 RepID=UPI002409C81A|nr:hypothetical protein [Novosphingobium lindaniclasticum]MDF2638125.1 hypothetical protein [Novosphingobium lindaniclasticum]